MNVFHVRRLTFLIECKNSNRLAKAFEGRNDQRITVPQAETVPEERVMNLWPQVSIIGMPEYLFDCGSLRRLFILIVPADVEPANEAFQVIIRPYGILPGEHLHHAQRELRRRDALVRPPVGRLRFQLGGNRVLDHVVNEVVPFLLLAYGRQRAASHAGVLGQPVHSQHMQERDKSTSGGPNGTLVALPRWRQKRFWRFALIRTRDLPVSPVTGPK